MKGVNQVSMIPTVDSSATKHVVVQSDDRSASKPRYNHRSHLFPSTALASSSHTACPGDLARGRVGLLSGSIRGARPACGPNLRCSRYNAGTGWGPPETNDLPICFHYSLSIRAYSLKSSVDAPAAWFLFLDPTLGKHKVQFHDLFLSKLDPATDSCNPPVESQTLRREHGHRRRNAV